MFDRIVVGTDGSETATEAVRTAIELAKMTKARLEIVSAYEPVPQSRLKEEGEGITGDVSHAINPREDVQFVLDKAAGVAKKAKVEVVTHPREGDPADAILDVAEENKADLDPGRQQGHDRGAPLPARQRAQQDLAPRAVRRVDRQDHLRGAWWPLATGRAAP